MDRDLIEKAAPDFDPEAILRARTRTWEAITRISSLIRPGMSEEEGSRLTEATLAEMGSTKRWHKSHVRFGRNTVKHYAEVSNPGMVLKDQDIFFLDLGPVWDGYEGDAGRTFVVGDDPKHRSCAKDSEAIHALVKAKWAQGKDSGPDLYRFAGELASERGWRINLTEANGHRLSDFPHKLYFRGGITEIDFVPAACRWVLEIQLRHPALPFGAFYEDLLI